MSRSAPLDRCKLACPEHAKAKFFLAHDMIEALRANLELFRRLAGGPWKRTCTCRMLERVEDAIRQADTHV